MPKSVLYAPDRQGMARLVRSQPIGNAVVAAAEIGLAHAQSSAPRRTGAFASSMEVIPAVVVGGRGNQPRAGAIIRNAVPYAAYVRKSKHAKSFMSSIVPHVNAVGRGRT